MPEILGENPNQILFSEIPGISVSIDSCRKNQDNFNSD